MRIEKFTWHSRFYLPGKILRQPKKINPAKNTTAKYIASCQTKPNGGITNLSPILATNASPRTRAGFCRSDWYAPRVDGKSSEVVEPVI